MRKRILHGCFVGIGSWLFLSAIPAAQSPTTDEQGELTENSSYRSTFDARLEHADRLERSDRFEEAIAIYEDAVQTGIGRDPRWTAYVLFRLAGAQYQSGDRIGAVESVDAAVTLDPAEPAYKALQADLSGVRRSTVYRAGRDAGSARRLTSSNGILHIFVHGRNTEYWDREEEDKTRRHIEEADQWLQARSAEKGVKDPPVFEHRYLTLLDEPFWRQAKVPDAEASLEYRKAWMTAVLSRFQAASYAELFDKIFEGADLDNRGVVFHAAKKRLSFAALIPCQKEPTDLESVFVLTERTEWMNPYEAVNYAHELLHLYGADDLFNKVPEPDIPDEEVMSFGAHCLDQCVLCALTGYAIGWTDQPPRLKRLKVVFPPGGQKRKKGTHV